MVANNQGEGSEGASKEGEGVRHPAADRRGRRMRESEEVSKEGDKGPQGAVSRARQITL